tara:strand:- start:209 stop:700 length:492 start_codon:yes stop_codon:yes gene_type:complete
MKKITLLRHGDSLYQDSIVNDWSRPLSPEGEKECHVVAKFVKDWHPLPSKIISSNARRTVETVKILLEKNKWDPGILYLDKELYLASARLLTEKIQSQSESINDLIIVGHNPGLSELSSSLLKQSIYLTTSGCVSLNINLDVWDLGAEAIISDKNVYLSDQNS